MPRTADEAYSLSASSQTQSTLRGVIDRLDAVLDARDAAVRRAMSDYTAHGVDERYRDAEDRWFRAPGQLRETIARLRGALVTADSTARDALAGARAAVSAVVA